MKSDEVPAAFGATLVALILFVVVLAVVAGPNPVMKFLNGGAGSWVGGLGTVAAIFATYRFGEQAHSRQLLRLRLDEIEQKRQRVLALKEVFSYAAAISLLVRELYARSESGRWNEVEVLAEDVLGLCRSIPLFDVPDYSLVARLDVTRQAMITYAENARRARPGTPSHATSVGRREFATMAEASSIADIEHCRCLAENLDSEKRALTAQL